jgi:hypothetical protein
MLFIDMMRNEIEVLIFGRGVCILYIVETNFYALLEHIDIYCYIVGAHFYAYKLVNEDV